MSTGGFAREPRSVERHRAPQAATFTENASVIGDIVETKEIVVASNATDGSIAKAVEAAATSLGLRIALRTSARAYPGSIHWHFKKTRETRGILELTYWPKSKRLWAKIHRGRRADWIAGSLAELADEVAARLPERKESSRSL